MDYSSVRTLQNTSKPITFRTPLPRISVALVSAISIRFNSMRHGFMAWRKLVDKGLCVLTGCLFCPWLQVVSTYGFFSLFVTHWRLLMVCHISTWPLFSHWWSKCRIFFHPFVFLQLLQRVCEDLYLRRIAVVLLLLYSERLLLSLFRPLYPFSHSHCK